MNRLNLLLTALVGLLFILLMSFAGQPITAEADLVQRWYDTLCDPNANQSLIYTMTYRDDESDAQLQNIIDAYRTANNFSEGCTAVENHNIIYFQAIPSALASNIDRIKFVAVNVYAPDADQTPNHVVSVQFGVHVLYYKSGDIKILPHFMPDSPLGLNQGTAPVTLYNNDNLLMGQVAVIGKIIQIPNDDVIRYGIPIQLSPIRTWGHCWIRIYVNGPEFEAERFSDILAPDQQTTFMSGDLNDLLANQPQYGVVWFTLPGDVPIDDLRIAVDAYQTLWDLRAIPAVIKVQ